MRPCISQAPGSLLRLPPDFHPPVALCDRRVRGRVGGLDIVQQFATQAVGTLNLKVSQDIEYRFSTEIFHYSFEKKPLATIECDVTSVQGTLQPPAGAQSRQLRWVVR